MFSRHKILTAPVLDTLAANPFDRNALNETGHEARTHIQPSGNHCWSRCCYCWTSPRSATRPAPVLAVNQFQKRTILPASDPKQCVVWHQQKILYVSLPIRAPATNHMNIVYKTYLCLFCTLRIARSSAGVMSPIHVVAFTNMDPLQDPHLRIHVSTSLCLRLLCKIHVSGSMCPIHVLASANIGPLQDPPCRIHSSAAICISGSSTRSTSSDSCLSIFVSHGFSARSTSPDSSLSIFISQDPLQDPRLRIHVSDSCLSIHQYWSSARSMSPDSCLSIFVPQDSLQDPCLRIHVSASTNMAPLQVPRLRIHVSASLYPRLLCKIHVSGSLYRHPYVSQDPLRIHVSGFMSQHLCISQSSARSMSPDPCLSIFTSQELLQDPRLRFMSYLPYHPILWPCAGETEILTSGDVFFVALRRKNRSGQEFAPWPKRLYPYRKNPYR